jgi:hypothetical protein
MAKTFDNKDVSYNKGKSYNLSKSQLKKAGAAKAAKARNVDISTTRRATTGANKGKTLGPAGKPLTGSVKLPSGVTAVYKDGKRVTTSRGKPASSGRGASGGSGGSGSTGSSTTVTPPGGGKTAAEKARARRVEENRNVKNGTVRVGAKGVGTRRYNSKTGRWERITGTQGVSSTSGSGSGQSSAQKPKPAAGTGQVPSAASTTSKPRATSASSSGRPGSSTYNSQVPREPSRTPAEAAYASASKAIADAVKKARGPWISQADKAKEAAKRKLVKDTIARATKGR